MNCPVSSSKCGTSQPPRSNPPLRSSSAPPGPCITPSTDTNVVVVSFMVPILPRELPGGGKMICQGSKVRIDVHPVVPAEPGA
jgi:hypothetical protein